MEVGKQYFYTAIIFDGDTKSAHFAIIPFASRDWNFSAKIFSPRKMPVKIFEWIKKLSFCFQKKV